MELSRNILEHVDIVEPSLEGNNDIEQIVTKIFRLQRKKQIIPVVCEDMYEYEDPETGIRQSLHSYIVERILGSLQTGTKVKLTEMELDEIVNGGYFGMSMLESKLGMSLYDRIYDCVFDDNGSVNNSIRLKKEVLEYFKSRSPQLIITTSCFPILEKELADTKDYQSYWYKKNNKNESTIGDDCVYHLFGKADDSYAEWGYNERQILYFLRSFYSESYTFKNLSVPLNSKTLLFLGNNAPDWLFRFILAPIYSPINNNIRDLYNSDKGYYLGASKPKEDTSLHQFLHDISFDSEKQLVEVLNRIVEKNGQQDSLVAPNDNSSQFDFFINHASEDKENVKLLVDLLRRKGFKVWVDYEHIKIGAYWADIIEGLRNSRFFMPFVTESYILKIPPKGDDIQQTKKQFETGDLHVNEEDALTLKKKGLEGVTIELLLAEQCVSENQSIPLLKMGSELYGNKITMEYIERMGEKKSLPSKLFYGVQMYYFDPQNIEDFSLDLDYLKRK